MAKLQLEELIQSNFANIVNKGIKTACLGKAIAIINNQNIILRPGNLFFANTYPPIVDVIHTNNIVQKEMKKLLNVHFNSGDLAKSIKF